MMCYVYARLKRFAL